MKKVELKRVQLYAVDVTLDPDTAQPNLILSDDGKEVSCGDVEKNLPDNTERFDTCPVVLAKQSFSSGRFYYEVQVKGKTDWDLGVARESISRKGEITASPQKGYWTICLWNKNEYYAKACPDVRLSLKQQPEKVGVFVDYEEGLVSFYDVDAAALIYSFTGCCFTEKLYPYFSPCPNYGGKNSAPLIISASVDMSAASCLLTEDQFLCSICLDVFTDPVSTPCGHNFCKTCITEHWNTNVLCQCPNCKKLFKTRPELQVNTFISEMAAQFRQSAQQKASSSSSEQQVSKPGEVEIQQMIQKRRLKIEEIKQSVELSKEGADREIADGVQVFTALKESVERSQAELIHTIKEKQRKTEKQAEGFIKELEQEISELKKRSSEVKQLSQSEDHLHLLQSFPSLNAAPPTKNWTEVSVHPPSYEGTVRRAVNQLEETLSKLMKKSNFVAFSAASVIFFIALLLPILVKPRIPDGFGLNVVVFENTIEDRLAEIVERINQGIMAWKDIISGY
ncbi:hypothetical protein L3Q82_007133 [Scortum barcoo]|uniref:Uncharacterized protein n=1 Tax=Scortum barcoo TaxID=214431 RepID=A0ACB8WSN7_9TELE|nr:hypothetical protein L3Q82_007133 [Scortum barcoo]